MQTLNLEFEFASLNIAITAKATTFLFGQSSLEFTTHIFTRRKLLLPNFQNNSIKFDASTPSEPTVAPKSLWIKFGSAHEWYIWYYASWYDVNNVIGFRVWIKNLSVKSPLEPGYVQDVCLVVLKVSPLPQCMYLGVVQSREYVQTVLGSWCKGKRTRLFVAD